jgi:hypothetical protein
MVMTRRPIRELAKRRSANLEVTLLWNRQSQRTWISVRDLANGSESAVIVPNERALDAFRHPYVYMAA